MSTSTRLPSTTPSRSPSPSIPIQPDHFYGSEGVQLPPSPESNGRTWLNPEDDPYASRGIPVFKPSLEEFEDFEGYMNKIECWGNRSGIVKVIPPKEWKDALPSLTEHLAAVKLKNPIEQHMLGSAGRYLQQNMEKRRTFSVREWAELCNQEDLRAPGVDDVGLHHAPRNEGRSKRRKKADATTRTETAEPDAAVEVKTEVEGDVELNKSASGVQPPCSHGSPSNSIPTPAASVAAPEEPIGKDYSTKAASPSPSSRHTLEPEEEDAETSTDGKQKGKGKGGRQPRTKEVREANLAQRQAKDAAFLENFDPDSDWLPPNTTPFDYTPEFCSKLERQYWRNLGFGKPALYGADMQGSLFTDETTAWNVAHLPSTLSRILPSSSNGLPGVNTPYLYFGMWRATFAWHVEDMDLFSINYIHFGAGKFWYAVPQGRAAALEQTMRGYFPDGPSRCPQFLRHKSYLASPNLLSKASCRPNTLVQQAGEFVITYPRGYHAGFNLGFNCAESVNFALESWLDLGRKAKACECVSDSVRIDVDQLLQEREAERLIEEARIAKANAKPRKRKSEDNGSAPKAKKAKTKSGADSKSKTEPKASTSGTASQPKIKLSLTLKLGPKPKEPEPFPCCLCCSMDTTDLLPVQDPPTVSHPAYAEVKVWQAHEECANVLPETWVDEVDSGPVLEDGTRAKAKVVFGVDAIVKDRWNLKCSACTKNRPKIHGAPVQCTKGKCSKAFHVTCARDGAASNIVYRTLGFVEKEVVFTDPPVEAAPLAQTQLGADGRMDVDSVSENQAGGDMAVDVPDPTVLKTIRKLEIELLCAQHNSAVSEAKKANKQDKIRNQLLALEPMARIKIRVSAGVFEVSLCRVLDENKSVEVLWDKGIKREFKWGSVVFGSTEGQTVGQMPTEPVAAPELHMLPPQMQQQQQPQDGQSTTPVTFPSFTVAMAAAAGNRQSASTTPQPPQAGPSQPAQSVGYLGYPTTSTYQYGRDAWPYYMSSYSQQQLAAMKYPTNTAGYGQQQASSSSYSYASYAQTQYMAQQLASYAAYGAQRPPSAEATSMNAQAPSAEDNTTSAAPNTMVSPTLPTADPEGIYMPAPAAAPPSAPTGMHAPAPMPAQAPTVHSFSIPLGPTSVTTPTPMLAQNTLAASSPAPAAGPAFTPGPVSMLRSLAVPTPYPQAPKTRQAGIHFQQFYTGPRKPNIGSRSRSHSQTPAAASKGSADSTPTLAAAAPAVPQEVIPTPTQEQVVTGSQG